jgi:hypothetical protein
MNNTDPIILTVYLLILLFILSNVVNSFNDEIEVSVDTEKLDQQLEEQGLKDILGIGFKFDKRYEFDKFKQLSVNVTNKSSSQLIYVDWDTSNFTDLDKRSRRVARLMPGMTLDLFQNQVPSAIAPNTTLQEKITAEDLLQRKAGDNAPSLELEVNKPFIDPDKFKKNPKFMKRTIELEFFLELAFRLAGSTPTAGGERTQILCRFVIRHLPWTVGLPWNPK